MTRKPEVPRGPKLLLSEGKDEQYLLPELLELAGVPWPKPPPVFIHQTDGVATLLDLDTVEAIYKEPDRTALGLVVDANGDVAARWNRARTMLTAIAPGFPRELSTLGIIHQEPAGPRLGLWLMPDNERAGMLETLLLAIRKDDPPVWTHVTAAVVEAKRVGAPFRDAHALIGSLMPQIIKNAGQPIPRHALG